MSEEQETEHIDAAETADEGAADATEGMISKEAAEAAIKRRVERQQRKHESEMAELRQQIEKLTSKNKQKSNGTAPDAALAGELAELKDMVSGLQEKLAQGDTEKAFQAAIAGKSIPEDKIAQLRDLFNPNKMDSFSGLLDAFPSKGAPDVAPTYSSPGAPNPAPVQTASNPMEWNKDTIARLRSTGEFRKKLDDWASAAHGASPFRRHTKR